MMSVLVTGANGQLGREIRKRADEFPEMSFYFTDVADPEDNTTVLDITDPGMVRRFLDSNPATHIVNCAAYTTVDKAEDDEAAALAVNAEAVEILAEEAAGRKILMIHLSTDYVFNGMNKRPYRIGDPTDPRTAYGRTKLAGEKALMDTGKGIIIRTSWLYSAFGHNFVKTILRLGAEKDRIQVVFDQVGSPTNARDLAGVILGIIKSEDVGGRKKNGPPVSRNDLRVYHYSNRGICSWYEFAREILSLSGSGCIVEAVDSSGFPTKAVRPRYSVMDTEELVTDYGLEIPHWKESLKDCIEELMNK